jgi:tripartite-type tricarboxylate transporter receptor subunit TctC
VTPLSPKPFHKSLNLHASRASTRIATLPAVPTLREKGIDYVRFGWLGFCAKNGTPQPIIDLLHRHLVSIVAMPEYHDLITKGGSIPESSTPQTLGKVIAQTVDDVAATITEFGLQQQ